MLVMVYLIAKVVWDEIVIARIAAILLAFEISLWHHVHRVHGPGILGEFFVLCFIFFLVAYRDSLQTTKGVLWFAGLSAVTLISYPAPVVQLLILLAWLTLLVEVVGEERTLLKGLLGGFSLGAGVAVAIYYAPYAIDALAKADILLDRGDYDPRATFFFLRNQMRDTVRILSNGYPLYVALSLVGLFTLGRYNTLGFHRRVLFAAVLTYVTMLILKDPIFLPRVFLHAKEDLFYSPIACLLAALPLASLWASRTLRGVALAMLLLLFSRRAVSSLEYQYFERPAHQIGSAPAKPAWFRLFSSAALGNDSVGARVHVQGLAAEKPDQSHAGAFCELHRQAGGRGNGGDERNAGHQGLLYDFETRPPAYHEQPPLEREFVIEERRADNLVHRVVPADVLADPEEPALPIEEPGGVEPSRFVEPRLG